MTFTFTGYLTRGRVRAMHRLMSRTIVTGAGCWECAYYKRKGYVQIWDGDKVQSAHRLTYEAVNGPIPEALQIDHLCRNRGCINPDHLEAVTQAVNIKRGDGGRLQRAVTHCPQGHAYDAANTHHSKTGRHCRKCKAAQSRIFRQRKKTSVLEAAHG